MMIPDPFRSLGLCVGALAVFGLVSMPRAQSQGEDRPKSPFRDQGDGTFQDQRTGLVWLKDPTKIPRMKSLAGAKAWVATLKSGEQGLKDGSKPGDWRLPTSGEWASAIDKKRLFEAFLIGWPEKKKDGSPVPYSRGYVSVDGDRVLTAWGDGFDSLGSLGWKSERVGYVWPVRVEPKK